MRKKETNVIHAHDGAAVGRSGAAGLGTKPTVLQQRRDPASLGGDVRGTFVWELLMLRGDLWTLGRQSQGHFSELPSHCVRSGSKNQDTLT